MPAVSTNTRDVPAKSVSLTITDVGGGRPFDVRLARALKCLLRIYGLRCTDVRPINPPNNPASEWRR